MWQRMKRAFRSVFGWMVSAAEDPELILEQNIRTLMAVPLQTVAPAACLERLRVTHGEMVTVSQNGTALKATAHVRADVPAGTAFLAEGIAADSANVLTEQTIEVSKDP